MLRSVFSTSESGFVRFFGADFADFKVVCRAFFGAVFNLAGSLDVFLGAICNFCDVRL